MNYGCCGNCMIFSLVPSYVGGPNMWVRETDHLDCICCHNMSQIVRSTSFSFFSPLPEEQPYGRASFLPGLTPKPGFLNPGNRDWTESTTSRSRNMLHYVTTVNNWLTGYRHTYKTGYMLEMSYMRKGLLVLVLVFLYFTNSNCHVIFPVLENSNTHLNQTKTHIFVKHPSTLVSPAALLHLSVSMCVNNTFHRSNSAVNKILEWHQAQTNTLISPLSFLLASITLWWCEAL